MKFRFYLLGCVVLLLFSYCNQPTADNSIDMDPQTHEALDKIKFIDGTWLNTYKHTNYEYWERLENGSWQGKAYSVINGDTTLQEKTRIYQIGKEVFYEADVEHNEDAVLFKLVSYDGSFVFENLEHDFPKRIIYKETIGNTMHARIEDDEKGTDFWFGKETEMEGIGPTISSHIEIELGVTDIDASIKFYEMMGYSAVSKDDKTALLTDSSVVISLKLTDEPFQTLAYKTPKLEEAISYLSGEGFEPISIVDNKVDDFKSVTYLDPDGATITISSDYKESHLLQNLNKKVECGVFGEYSIPVADIEASMGFWKNFGFRVIHKASMPYNWGIMSDGHFILGIHEATDFDKITMTYFSAQSADVIEKLKQNGLDVRPFVEANIEGEGSVANGGLSSPDGHEFFIFYGGF